MTIRTSYTVKSSHYLLIYEQNVKNEESYKGFAQDHRLLKYFYIEI